MGKKTKKQDIITTMSEDSYEEQKSGDDHASNISDDELDGQNSTQQDDDAGERGDDHKRKKEGGKKSKVFSDKFLSQTENFNEKLKKRGVVYIARIPPRMTPTKVKTLLSEFGEVTRVFLVEEDKTVRQRRKKQGGSGSKRYTEGWVEFAKKKVAKHVAASLNNTPISNYKRSSHFGDLWNLKYLNKFKWSHLTEKVAYERRVREQKLRVEMMQARRENAQYVELVETGKKLDKIEERKRKREEKTLGTRSNLQSVDFGVEDTKKKRKGKQTTTSDERAESATKAPLLRALVEG